MNHRKLSNNSVRGGEGEVGVLLRSPSAVSTTNAALLRLGDKARATRAQGSVLPKSCNTKLCVETLRAYHQSNQTNHDRTNLSANVSTRHLKKTGRNDVD
mmetsp:Transcript_8839/g.20584  ORF Transcript_8839/g.20584 Transcript_8839/m.20584 type:complete len:100 (+) Transcript_8839:53-352(+)